MSGNRMSARRGEIGLGDLATALARLEIVSEAQLRVVGRCLGLGGLSFGSVGTLQTAADARLKHRRPPPRPQEPKPQRQLPPLPAAPPGPPAERLDTVMEPLPAAVSSEILRPEWFAQPAAVIPRERGAPRAALFPQHTAPGLLSAAVATLRPGRWPDIDRLVEHIIAHRPFREVPRLPVPSQSRGVQLLLDRNAPMTPFYADQGDLVRSFAAVVGQSRCEVCEFVDDPAAACAYSLADQPTAWRPQPGRPVVVVSDFGLGESSGSAPRLPPQAWRRFATALKRRGCPLIAIVPFPPAAWPVWVERHFIAIHWDPRTRAENVRALVGAGHLVAP